MSDEFEGHLEAYTVRLELEDRPGELLRTLEPIASNGGNLLSIFHQRGNITPRGHIPVEIDLECPPDRFDVIVEAIRDAGVNIIQAGADQYSEEVVVLLIGDLVASDLSDTIERMESSSIATVVDFALSVHAEESEEASARVHLATERGGTEETLETVRSLAAEKGIDVIESIGTEVEA